MKQKLIKKLFVLHPLHGSEVDFFKNTKKKRNNQLLPRAVVLF